MTRSVQHRDERFGTANHHCLGLSGLPRELGPRIPPCYRRPLVRGWWFLVVPPVPRLQEPLARSQTIYRRIGLDVCRVLHPHGDKELR